MSPQFIGERIEVSTRGEVKEPVSFQWRDTRYVVTDILLRWMDWGFASGARQRNWQSRHHRNYFRVQTASGEIFEIYLDRGRSVKQGAWYLYQRLD